MEENSVHHKANKSAPLIVELVGLAGAGKTTLLRALTERDSSFRIVSDLEIRNPAHLPIFIKHAHFMLSLVRQPRHRDGRFTWDEMKAMIYLMTWPYLLKAEMTDKDRAILLNHGPIFKMATLHAFGPQSLHGDRFEHWWHKVFEQWSRALDLIIWLKAPDKVLQERINSRSQRHVVKDKSEAEVARFLACYQNSYEYVLTKLTAYGGPPPVRFDTSETSVDLLVEEVLHSCSQKLARGKGAAVTVP
jgi:shikimate kinase